MTKLVSIQQNKFFADQKNVEKLNSLLYKHDILSPGLLMGATGCDYQDALYVLLLLFEMNLAEGFLQVYNALDPDLPIERRPFRSGFPKTPFKYRREDHIYEILTQEGFLYAFEFDLSNDDIVFAGNKVYEG